MTWENAPGRQGKGLEGRASFLFLNPKELKKKKNLETDTCLCVYMCVPCTHDSSKKQFILHPPFVSLGKIRTPAPPGPLPPSSRRCRKQGPLEVQTLITENIFQNYKAWPQEIRGSRRRARRKVGRASPPRAAEAGLEVGTREAPCLQEEPLTPNL